MVSLDLSIFILMFNFLLLIWIMNMILYKPIRKILVERKEKITGLEGTIEGCAKDVDDQKATYVSGIKAARAKGQKEKEALLQAATEEESAIIGKINEKAKAELVEIKEKISKDADAVRVELEKEIDAFVDAIGNKILGRAA